MRKTWIVILMAGLAAGCGRSKWPAGRLVEVDRVDLVRISWRGAPHAVQLLGIRPLPTFPPPETVPGEQEPAAGAAATRKEEPKIDPLDRRGMVELRNLLAKQEIFFRTDGLGIPEGQRGPLRVYLHVRGPKGDIDVGAALLAQGLALADEGTDHPRRARYLAIQEEAKAAKRGWWGR